MERIIVSIIVPAYNAYDKIHETISSITRQSLIDIEVIVIDDGSTDLTCEIVRNFSSRDRRVRLVKNNRNMGRSYSRNIGINISKGDYIMFCDADDFLPESACENLYNSAIKSNADLVRGSYLVSSGDKKSEVNFKNSLSNSLVINPLEASMLGCFTSVLYRRKMLDMYQISFPVDMNIGEDNVFLAECILYASSINYISDITYVYNLEVSGTIRAAWSEDDFECYIQMYERIKKLWPLEVYAIYVSRNVQYWVNNVFPKILEKFRDDEQLYWVRKNLSAMELDLVCCYKSASVEFCKRPKFIFEMIRALKADDIRLANNILNKHRWINGY